jgi:hypothetical protein
MHGTRSQTTPRQCPTRPGPGTMLDYKRFLVRRRWTCLCLGIRFLEHCAGFTAQTTPPSAQLPTTNSTAQGAGRKDFRHRRKISPSRRLAAASESRLDPWARGLAHAARRRRPGGPGPRPSPSGRTRRAAPPRGRPCGQHSSPRPGPRRLCRTAVGPAGEGGSRTRNRAQGPAATRRRLGPGPAAGLRTPAAVSAIAAVGQRRRRREREA